MVAADILRQKGSDVLTITADELVATAASVLSHNRIGALVVVDLRERPTGLISERDIVGCLARRGSGALRMEVGEVMGDGLITCRPEDEVRDLMALMTRRRVRHVPVVADGQLQGIVSIGDIMKSRLDEVQLETNVLRDRLLGHS